MTNGDKIRSMTNEKLAEELATFSADCLFCDGCEREQGFNVCVTCIKKWLEEEAEWADTDAIAGRVPQRRGADSLQ